MNEAQWAPQGDELAYSRDADLYVASIGRSIMTRRVTRGGIPDTLLNGSLDWVYPEELGIDHGFRWSPDGSEIAYLTMDERRVTNFPIVELSHRQQSSRARTLSARRRSESARYVARR